MGSALAAALGSLAWNAWPNHGHARTRRKIPFEAKLTAVYHPAVEKSADPEPQNWPAPSPQSRGAEWLYDLFTPPEIDYDATTRRFAVVPPRDGLGNDEPGLELVAVRRMPFRLQLLGYVAGKNQFLGTFENETTGEIFLAGAGQTLPKLGLEITEFSVEQQPLSPADRSGPKRWVAQARVNDEQNDESTTLIAGERSYTGELRAILATGDDDDKSLHELRLGEEVFGAQQNYVLARLELDPPTVELVSIAPAGSVRPVGLTLVPKLEAGSAETQSAISRLP